MLYQGYRYTTKQHNSLIINNIFAFCLFVTPSILQSQSIEKGFHKIENSEHTTVEIDRQLAFKNQSTMKVI